MKDQMNRELMMAMEERYIEEITDDKGKDCFLNCDCVVEHYFFPEDNGINIHHSRVFYDEKEIHTYDYDEDNKAIEVCKQEVNRYKSMAYDSREER